MKSRKQKQDEYQNKYSNVPIDRDERLSYMIDKYKISEKDMDSIMERRNNTIANMGYFEYKIVLFMEPEGTPRHRYRLITPKNYTSIAKVSPYVHVYQPRAHEDHVYFKRLMNHELDEMEEFRIIQTPFMCDIATYFKIPSNYNKSDRMIAELGLDFNIKKPDVDNIEKKYLDMFNANIWLDDNMCFSGTLSKYFSELPRVEIIVRYLISAMNKQQYDHIISRVGYRSDQPISYLNRQGNYTLNLKEGKE